jgi:hypothetical protein
MSSLDIAVHFAPRYGDAGDYQFVLDRFVDGNNALTIFKNNGYYGRASTNIPEVPTAGTNMVLIAMYGAHEGMVDAMVTSGVVRDTGERLETDVAQWALCEVLLDKVNDVRGKDV